MDPLSITRTADVAEIENSSCLAAAKVEASISFEKHHIFLIFMLLIMLVTDLDLQEILALRPLVSVHLNL